jgi:hypothetical protein
MKTEQNKKNLNKKAVSEMLAYVILIVIAIAVSVGVYAWFRATSGVGETPKCPDEVPLVIQEASCTLDGTVSKLTLTVKNKGLFDIKGYDIRGTTDAAKKPVIPLGGTNNGRYTFGNTLAPNTPDTKTFTNVGNLAKIEIEPFREQEGEIILCDKAIITQEVSCV